jgi:hypothetical protein
LLWRGRWRNSGCSSGVPIKIVSDHLALCWLQTKKELAGRLYRWAMQLMEFKYSIVHKDGRLHSAADALSRYPIEGQSVSPLEVNLVTQKNQNGLQEGQRSEWVNVYMCIYKGDSKLRNLQRAAISNAFNGQRARWGYFSTMRTKGTTRRCAVCHDYIMEGHLRRNWTIDKVQQRFFWRSLTHDVERYVKSCKKCQSRKMGVFKKLPAFF